MPRNTNEPPVIKPLQSSAMPEGFFCGFLIVKTNQRIPIIKENKPSIM